MRIAQSVRKLEPYTPGEQPKSRRAVKLNTNENAYPPSPACAKALASTGLESLRKYPDPEFRDLRRAIAKRFGTDASRVFAGNGSDEILSLAAKAFVEDGEAIASLDPSYSLYKTLAAIRNVRWTGLGTGDAAAETPSALAKRLARERASLFLWTNPNAPTGAFAEPEQIAAFAAKFKGIVIVDEAYADFARGDCMALATAPGNRNTIVMRTFSKSYSLAGLRVGFCVGPEDLIEALYKVKDSYNVDAVAQRVALAAFNDRAYHRKTVAAVKKTRAAFTGELEGRGWDVIPSESNFVFAKPPSPLAAKDVFDALRRMEIYVRYFPGPLTGDRLRITIGTDAQMAKLLAALDRIARTGGAARGKRNGSRR